MVGGTAVATEDVGSAEELVRRAETALVKSLKWSRAWTVYDPSMEPDPQDLRLVADFRRVGVEVLRAVFQPQLDLRTGHISGAEALVRWQHPELGAVSPARLYPIAESSGSSRACRATR